MSLTGKDHFIEFCKHSGMVNTKFNLEEMMRLAEFDKIFVRTFVP